MNRAERRREEKKRQAEERQLQKQAALQFEKDLKKDGTFDSMRALNDARYMKKVVDLRLEQRKSWEKNGITKDDLDKEYDRGYKAAQKELATMYATYFFCAACIMLHRDFKFGDKRLHRALQTMYNIMTWEITTCDILERCEKETGVKIDMIEMENECEVDIYEQA